MPDETTERDQRAKEPLHAESLLAGEDRQPKGHERREGDQDGRHAGRYRPQRGVEQGQVRHEAQQSVQHRAGEPTAARKRPARDRHDRQEQPAGDGEAESRAPERGELADAHFDRQGVARAE